MARVQVHYKNDQNLSTYTRLYKYHYTTIIVRGEIIKMSTKLF
jgi:hypothetical protein